jgi:hypothetical protein
MIDYYRGQGVLRSVDGMAPIPNVTAAIDQVLLAGAKSAKRPKSAAATRPAARQVAAMPEQTRKSPKAKSGPQGCARSRNKV